jgi:hypothetical protein
MTALKEWRPVGLGFAGGAMLLTLLGFTVFGWLPASTAAQAAKDQAAAAVVAALSEICVSQFNADASAPARLERLKALSSYAQGSFVAEGGWATMPGRQEPAKGVAKGCADVLIAS